MSLAATGPLSVDFVPGGTTGVTLPVHPGALREAGVEWLTNAMRAYGSLPADNAVTAITACVPFAAGNSGDKLLLTVEYARADPGLHSELFVKFSRCLGDPFRDRRAHELDGEVRLAALSRHPAFPVAVAKPYFADFDPASAAGLLITQRIRYGEGGIEPLRAKNMDHELADPVEYYRATITALARLAAAHQSGRLSPEAERLFPFDAAAAAAELALPWSAAQLSAKAAAIAAFIADCPQLFPASVRTGEFAARLAEDALAFERHDAAIRRFLHADPRLIALAHWNTHIDNAWFWRDAAGVLRAGLLDWGMVRPMNLAAALWGGLSGAGIAMGDSHDALLAHFRHELSAHGGAAVAPEELRLHLDLTVVQLTLALMFDTPALLRARMPGIAALSGPDDPRLARDRVVQGFLHTFAAALDLWARHRPGDSLVRLMGQGAPTAVSATA